MRGSSARLDGTLADGRSKDRSNGTVLIASGWICSLLVLPACEDTSPDEEETFLLAQPATTSIRPRLRYRLMTLRSMMLPPLCRDHSSQYFLGIRIVWKYLATTSLRHLRKVWRPVCRSYL